LYAAIGLDIKPIPDVALFSRHGANPAAAFLQPVTEKHDFSEVVFLRDAFGYQTAFIRLGINGRVEHTDRNLIEK
jgi:putative transposase